MNWENIRCPHQFRSSLATKSIIVYVCIFFTTKPSWSLPVSIINQDTPNRLVWIFSKPVVFDTLIKLTVSRHILQYHHSGTIHARYVDLPFNAPGQCAIHIDPGPTYAHQNFAQILPSSQHNLTERQRPGESLVLDYHHPNQSIRYPTARPLTFPTVRFQRRVAIKLLGSWWWKVGEVRSFPWIFMVFFSWKNTCSILTTHTRR